MKASTLAKIDKNFRSLFTSLLWPHLVVKLYSSGRNSFLKKLVQDIPQPYYPPKELSRTLWGINFRSPLFNAAGMFKNGEGYKLCHAQGAGAYLAGTTTANSRKGNLKNGIYLPFSPYPRSGAASNWLGLPNDGDKKISTRIQAIKKSPSCPVGVSVMGSPDFEGEEKVNKLISGMHLYKDAGVDFIEINESCPNTEHGKPQDDDLYNRLKSIKTEFLDKRENNKPPVIVKFSNDTDLAQVDSLMAILFELGFDGVNFGNSSVAYDEYKKDIHKKEQKLYQHYTKTFGGGLTGKPLKEKSLQLVSTAKYYLDKNTPNHEFHIIRTGGVENAEDVAQSLESGASLVQWYTGYFEAFSTDSHELYKKIDSALLNQLEAQETSFNKQAVAAR